jgi:tetratricopeptide (TPR) repeat protein
MPNDPAAVAACSGSNYLIPLRIEGRSGGWGDRSGDKSERYIKYLELDLIDYPDDPRTLYYLGDSHLGAFERNMANPGPKDMEHLAKAVSWFERRSKVKGGHREETWWTTLKVCDLYRIFHCLHSLADLCLHLQLGEIQERFYRNWEKALPYYEWCVREDPERADATFYIGQHYRINGDPARGFPFLLKAAGMPIPDRAVFNWHYLYKCLSKLELGRCAMSLSDSQMTLSQLKETHQLVASVRAQVFFSCAFFRIFINDV